MVALQAGCEQKPAQGELLSLSGTIFTTGLVNITEPEVDPTTQPKGAGSSTLTTGAIVGIAVGVGLFLFGGIALFFIYRRRQKHLNPTEKSDYNDDNAFAGTPDPILPPGGGYMSSSLRSHSQQSHHGKGPSMTSGEYYDSLEEEAAAARGGSNRINYNFDPRSRSRGPNSAIPAHQAYIPRAVSRLKSDDSIGSSTRTASPPAAGRGHSRSHTIGSLASHPYQPSQDNVKQAPGIQIRPPPPASRRAASVDTKEIGTALPGPPPGPPPPKKHGRTPSLGLPSLRKMRRPKQYAPPQVEPDASSSAAAGSGDLMNISQPVMSLEARFQDRPLQGGPVYETGPRVPEREKLHTGYEEVPMRSGKSTLYG